MLASTLQRGLALSLVLATVSAQEFLGITNNTAIGATSRGSLGGAPGQVIARIDRGDYSGWATDVLFPGMRVINGVDLIIQDQDAVATFEVFDIWLYPEDPFAPNMPLLAAGIPVAIGVAGPPPPAAGLVSAAYVDIAIAPPILMPAGSDVFVGFALPPNAIWPMDGLSVQIVLGVAVPGFPTFDLAGPSMAPAPPAGNSYGLTFNPALVVPLVYNGRRQLWTDLQAAVPGGVVGAITTQFASFAPSTVAPGTASLMSGLHPDAAAPPLNAGRADDISYTYFDAALPAGMPVIFCVDFAPLGAELPLAAFVPGSVGVLCLTPMMTPLTMLPMGAGSVSQVILIPPAFRPVLAGFPIAQQAVGFSPAGLRGSPCGRQIL